MCVRFKTLALSLIMCVLCIQIIPAYAGNAQQKGDAVPYSQEFIEWMQYRKNDSYTKNESVSTKGSLKENATGYIPDHIDRSELWKNPPKELKTSRTSDLPAKYDLRTDNRIPSAVRNQNPYGTCWAFAAIGSMESTYLTKKYANTIDLSEMHLAYFVYGDTRAGKSYPVDSNFDILNQGGNLTKATAFLSRMGTVSESILS